MFARRARFGWNYRGEDPRRDMRGFTVNHLSTDPDDAQFDLRYQPHSTNVGEGELEIEEDDLTTAFYQNEEIDLEQLMREQFYLALPMKPLCSRDCKGLCPTCGTNLNRATCDCKRDVTDPRLAVLKKLEVRSKK